MNKKGILISETLKMVLSVMSIVLLFILAFQLFGLIGSKNEISQAREHMDKLEEIIARLEKQGSGSEEYILLNPKEWSLIAFPHFAPSPKLTNQHPDYYTPFDLTTNECVANKWENCLCFCPYTFPNAVVYGTDGSIIDPIPQEIKNAKKECDKLSLCFELNQDDVIVSSADRADRNSYLPVKSTKTAVVISLENGRLTIIPK